MCGIAGLWAPDLRLEERRALVASMLGALAHRGPDGMASWSDASVTLGLTRLAIVAPEAPTQVIANETGRIHAVVNGEIYNHRSLAGWLVTRGHDVPAGPDTGVVVHLYEELGCDFPAEMDGMFAAAIWDAGRRRLILARDRAGEKPLFTSRAADRFAFASEPAALLRLPWVSRDPAPESLARYLAHGFFAGGDCAFASLRQVPPATLLEVEEGFERPTRYWRPWDALAARPGSGSRPLAAGEADDRALVEITAGHLDRSVATRIPREMPFGVLLSGGLDSGLIAAAASQTAERFPTFSMRLVGEGYDESAYARLVADHLGTEHHEVTMDHGEGEAALESFAAGMDQPLGDPSVLPTWLIARFAARYVPVVLTGEGGDELFAGYPTYLGHRYARLADRLPPFVGRAALACARLAGPSAHHLSVAHLVEQFVATRHMEPWLRHLAWFGNFGAHQARALLAPELGAALTDADALGYLRDLERGLSASGLRRLVATPGLAGYQLLDFELYLGGGLLTKVDRCTMAHGIESRAPFLKRELVELALSLPDRAKLRGTTGKWILKRIANGVLPPRIAARRKQGFSPPFSAWARGPLRREVQAILDPRRVKRAGVLDPAAAEAVLNRHLSGEAECGRALWSLVSLELWAERWVTGRAIGAGSRASSASDRPPYELSTTGTTATIAEDGG